MLNHVLVPLDGSPLAEQAIEPAVHLLNPRGTITMVIAVDVFDGWGFGVQSSGSFGKSRELNGELLPKAQSYLDEFAANLRTRNFTVNTVARVGEAAEIILDTAAVYEVSAIVMTTHGRRGFNRLLFGSVTAKVLAAAERPVLVLPSKNDMQEIDGKHIAITTWPAKPTDG